MEKFESAAKTCSCCKLRLHVYQFPIDRKTGTRHLVTCIACQRDCYGRRKCNLGRTWGCAECKLTTEDSPHPTTGHGGNQYLL